MAPQLTRSPNRVIAGVCAGLAEHLHLSVGLVRVIMVAFGCAFGAGVVFYGWLWILVPVAGEGVPAAGQRQLGLFGPSRNAVHGADFGPDAPGARARFPLGGREIILGMGLVVGAGVLLAQQLGVNLSLGTLIPLAVIAAGAMLAWRQLDEARRVNLMGAAKADKPAGLLRLVAGLVLVVAGVLTIVAGGGSWDLIWPSVLASLAVLAGVGLVLAPWVLKFWTDLQGERAGRIRQTERAEIAAHLHDSVLQTLALIQKRAQSPADVQRLARAQERELREWIYRDATRNPANLVARINGLAAELEDVYGYRVEVVAVGDAVMTERGEALIQAAREAMVNAVRHAATDVAVYVEATAGKTDIFIKDRGSGFDPASIAADRLGVRESVVGRMHRHGGRATILSGPDGTEVRLSLPAEKTVNDKPAAEKPTTGP